MKIQELLEAISGPFTLKTDLPPWISRKLRYQDQSWYLRTYPDRQKITGDEFVWVALKTTEPRGIPVAALNSMGYDCKKILSAGKKIGLVDLLSLSGDKLEPGRGHLFKLTGVLFKFVKGTSLETAKRYVEETIAKHYQAAGKTAITAEKHREDALARRKREAAASRQRVEDRVKDNIEKMFQEIKALPNTTDVELGKMNIVRFNYLGLKCVVVYTNKNFYPYYRIHITTWNLSQKEVFSLDSHIGDLKKDFNAAIKKAWQENREEMLDV